MSFKVESPPLTDAPQGEVFHAHQLVLKTCAKGSILASLFEDCGGNSPLSGCSEGIPSYVALCLRRGYISCQMERLWQRLA